MAGHLEPSLADRVARSAGVLTSAERRVAETLLGEGRLAAFGTVAEVARAAGAGAATVMRTASKLGFEGFSALQGAARLEMASDLAPAAERIHRTGGPLGDLMVSTFEIETVNLRRTFDWLSEETVERVVDDLADLRHRVVVVSGEAGAGAALQFARDLAALRPDVTHPTGTEVAVVAHLSQMSEGDLVVAIDLRRYDRWLLEAMDLCAQRRLRRLVVTDSVLSPLAGGADHCVVVAASASGPFDSYVATLAVANLLVAATAQRLRRVASERLARAEWAWQQSKALVDP